MVEELQHFEAVYETSTTEFDAETWPAALNTALTSVDDGTGDLIELRWLWATDGEEE